MATSGTAVWNPDVGEIIEEAYERLGLQAKTGWDFKTAVRSLNYLISELANEGLNMWSFETVSLSLTYNDGEYSLPADTIDVLDGTLRTNAGNAVTQNDLVMTRIPYSEYVALPNKLDTGQPVQYTVQRGTTTPTLLLWPIPDNMQAYVFFYLRLRRTQDAGNALNTLDVPFRFTAAVTSGLAYHLGCKRRPELIPMLQARYAQDLKLAQSEDRDRSDWRIVPSVGRI